MRLLVIDPGFGAAGDMMCGALLAAGADRNTVLCAMRSVAPEFSVSQVVRCGMPALYVQTHTGPAHRTLDEVLEIVRSADAPAAAVSLAERVFTRIAAAEEVVHGTHHVHFHEVGADDAIADVLGAYGTCDTWGGCSTYSAAVGWIRYNSLCSRDYAGPCSCNRRGFTKLGSPGNDRRFCR